MTTTEKNKEAIRLHVLISECYTVELINNPTHVDITIDGFISEDGDKQKQRTLLRGCEQRFPWLSRMCIRQHALQSHMP